jgi:hypothetical protein
MRTRLLCLVALVAGILGAGPPNANGFGQLSVGATSSIASTLVVHPAQTYGPASPYLIGGDLLSGSGPFTGAAVATAASAIGLTSMRYPQGTVGNCLHWSTNTCGSGGCSISQNAANTDGAFVTLLGSRLGHVVVNEATNAACTAGNTTADVTGMINDIVSTQGCPDTRCLYWTIDNEQYNSGALTLSCTPNSNQDCYASQFATFRTAMLAQDSGIKVCPDADPQKSGPQGSTWDAHVLIGTFDCVDAHYYWTTSGSETDAGALAAPAGDFTANFMAQLKTDLAASGSPSAKIIIGEYSTIPSTYSYQTESIIQALFNAEMVGEAAQDGVTVLEFHAAVANCQAVNVRAGLYGSWLTFTGSQSSSNGSGTGTCNGVSGQPPAGTLLAPGSGLQVAAQFTQAGETILKSTLTDTTGDLAAYQSTYGGSYSIMLVNRSQVNTHSVTVSIDGKSSGAGGSITAYSKAIFDRTNQASPAWSWPATSTLSPWTSSFTITTPPWSVTVVHPG